MKILVVGGAGYIGCHIVDDLILYGHTITVLDNLSSGQQKIIAPANLIIGDLGDEELLNQLFSQTRFDAVIYVAGFIEIADSVNLPAKYYENNIYKILTLLNNLIVNNITRFIFSSSAAVYGEPHYSPMDEDHPKNPLNPYGKSKWMIEQILQDYQQAYDFRAVSLRYFNAAGADSQARFGECHEPESHLLPLILQVANQRREALFLYGDDYATPDGSCIRDYVHVSDLAEAHRVVLEKLSQDQIISEVYNLGNGRGYSVKEVIAAAEKITGREINVDIKPRRAGDAPILVADIAKIQRELQWRPQYSQLENIIESAWRWELQHFTHGHPKRSEKATEL